MTLRPSILFLTAAIVLGLIVFVRAVVREIGKKWHNDHKHHCED